MAINPNIVLAGDTRLPLAVQVPDTSRIFSNALLNVSRLDAIKEGRASAPLRNELLQSQVQQSQAAAADIPNVLADQAEARRIESIVTGSKELLPIIQTGNVDAVRANLLQRRARLAERNIPTNDTDEALALLDQPGGFEQLADITKAAVTLSRPDRSVATRSSAPITDPKTGQVSIPTFDPNTNTTSLVPLAGAIQETPSQEREAEALSKIDVAKAESRIKGKEAAVKAAVAKGSKTFDRIQPLTVAIQNYDQAIAAIDAGAETGIIDAFLPSFRKASIELDNVVKRLGLDVVGNTTFGALSESELKFALNAAIPDTLQPADLKQWLIAKRDAQRKVKERVEQAASFLSEGTHTIKDWIEFDAANQLNQKNQAEAAQAQAATPAPQENPITGLSDEDLLNF